MDFEIVKIGGSAITDKSGFETAKPLQIRLIAKILAKHFLKGNKFVLVLGAGSFAHPHVLKFGLSGKIHTPKHIEGVQEIHKSVANLAGMMAEELEKNSCKTMFCPINALAILDNKKIVEFNMAPFTNALAHNIMPITIGDMARDITLGYAPLSGDKILSHMGKRALRAVLVSDMEGVMADGKIIQNITNENFKIWEKHLGGSKNTDVTGGMRGKVLELLEMKAPAIILTAGKDGSNLSNALSKKEFIGTRIN